MQNWQLLSASKTITIHSSQSQSSSPIVQYNPHRGIVNCAVYNHTSKVIASCGQDGKIALHNASRCQDKLLQLTYYGSNEDPSSINCCAFSLKSKYIAAGSVNSSIKIWDMKSHKQKQAPKKLKGHSGAVTSIAWMNNQQIIASGSTAGDILLHDVILGSVRDSLVYSTRSKEGISNIKISEGEDFRRLAACTYGGSLYVWDINSSTKKPIYSYDDPKKSSLTCLSISSYSPVFIACSSMDSNIIFMDINEKKIIKTFCTDEPITSITFNENGQILAAGGLNGGLMIYDLRKIQSPLIKLTGHDTPLKSVCFCEKEKYKEREREKEKQREREREKAKITTNHNKNSNLSQNGQRLSNDYPTISQHPSKFMTPVGSLSKLGSEQQRSNQNQSRKQQRKQNSMSTTQQKIINQTSQTQSPKQQQLPIYSQNHAPPIPFHCPPRATQNFNASTTINSNKKNLQNENQNQIKNLQEKMLNQMKSIQLRFNEKFQILHLQIIRQMQLSIEKMQNWFEKSHRHQKELLIKIKQLQQENENLRNKTY